MKKPFKKLTAKISTLLLLSLVLGTTTALPTITDNTFIESPEDEILPTGDYPDDLWQNPNFGRPQ